jgi:hypothetical protein
VPGFVSETVVAAGALAEVKRAYCVGIAAGALESGAAGVVGTAGGGVAMLVGIEGTPGGVADR